jgi:SAM-dependent methyltransferase
LEINLLAKYPKSKRNLKNRVDNKEISREVALRFGREYFDGSREQGYGGYHYDGRWLPIARDIIEHFNLKPGDRVLDVGCAKGFLVHDLMKVVPGIDAYGLDISEYALFSALPEVIGRLHLGNATNLPFPDGSFQAVISINTIHNLNRDDCIGALREIERVSMGGSYIQVDAYTNPDEKKAFEDWMLTAKTYGTPDDWQVIFKEAGFTGDYYWTIFEEN